MSVPHVMFYNVRFCGDQYSGARLTSTNNTMTLVFQSLYNYYHWTGFSASYIVTGSGKYRYAVHLVLVVESTCLDFLLFNLLFAVVNTHLPPTLLLLAVSIGLEFLPTTLLAVLLRVVVNTGLNYLRPTMVLAVVSRTLLPTLLLKEVSTGLNFLPHTVFQLCLIL